MYSVNYSGTKGETKAPISWLLFPDIPSPPLLPHRPAPAPHPILQSSETKLQTRGQRTFSIAVSFPCTAHGQIPAQHSPQQIHFSCVIMVVSYILLFCSCECI